MLRYFHIDHMARRFRPAVYGVMLGRGNHPKIFWVVTLHSGNESDSHSSSKKWIFAVGFLTAAPAGIPENVNVRRPEIQALHDVATSGAHRMVMLCARFRADYDCHVVDQRRIKACGESNRFREDGSSSGIGNSMKSFTPPVVAWDLQARDGSCLVYELRSLFFKRHSRHQIVHSLAEEQRWIEVGRNARRRRGLRDRRKCCYKDQGDDQ